MVEQATLIYSVGGAYRLIPNWNVKNFIDRLRKCNALTAMEFLSRHKVHPKEAEAELKKNVTSVRVVNAVLNVPMNSYEFGFQDRSILRWINDLGQYAIMYPPVVKMVYIPHTIPAYKDAILTAAAEDELIKDVQAKKLAQTYPYSDWEGD